MALYFKPKLIFLLFPYYIVTGGTDNHIVLVDLRSKKLSGSKAELILEEIGISVNKNTVPGDKSAMNPSGIRFGTPPLSTRGVQPEHIKNIVGFIGKKHALKIIVVTDHFFSI